MGRLRKNKKFVGFIITALVVTGSGFAFFGAGAQVIVDSTTEGGYFSNTDPETYSHTHPASGCDNGLVVVTVHSNLDVDGATYGGETMTEAVGAANSTNIVHIFYLVDPPTGSNTVSVDFSASNGYGESGAVSACDVDQDNPLDVTNSGTGSSNTSSVAVTTSNAGALIVEVIAVAYSFGSAYTPGAGQTEFTDCSSCSQGEGAAAYELVDTAATYTQIYNWTSTFNNDAFAHAVAVFNFKAADTCEAPASGDWTIRASDNCYIQTDVAIQADIIILADEGQGSLNIIDGAELSFNCIKYNTSTPINMESGTKLTKQCN